MFVFKKIDPRRRKLRKTRRSDRAQAALDAISDYIENGYQEPVKWLCRFWGDQQKAMLYGDLIAIAAEKPEAEQIFSDWHQDYSKLIAGNMTDLWRDTMIAGWRNNPVFSGLSGFELNSSEERVRTWLVDHGAEMVTNCSSIQRDAVRYIVSEAQSKGMSSAETARYIRPTVGLTKPQAAANLKYYESVKESLKADHPRMKAESIERKAREAAAKYAAKQQRTRAETIARTEIARAYNKGNDEAVRQAMAQGLLPKQRKVWSTAEDGHVCSDCEGLEGMQMDMDDDFRVQSGRRTITVNEPPLHPRCKCALLYEDVEPLQYEVENPVENPQGDDTIIEEPEDTSAPDTIPIPDTQIFRSVGARARNYDIIDPNTDEKYRFVEGTKIQNSEVFAGYGTRHPLAEEVAQGLAGQIGGDPSKWQHCKGIGHIDVDGEDVKAEVHWFQEETVGKHKFKIKKWVDDES